MNHRRKSGAYSKPANRTGTIAPAFLGETQRERVIELLLITGFGADLLIRWRALVDPGTTIRWAEATRPFMSRRAAREALVELEGDDDGMTVATLLAATRWFCSLDLPASREELWSGPPLFGRRKGSDMENGLITRSQITEFVHGLDGQGISVWCSKHGVSEEALELVVETFAKDREEGVAVNCAFRVGVEAGEVGRIQGDPSTEAQHLRKGAGGNDG